jgi:hypothetical protein
VPDLPGGLMVLPYFWQKRWSADGGLSGKGGFGDGGREVDF